jgi:5-methylcytosine-specific restriction endonuclease McrA
MKDNKKYGIDEVFELLGKESLSIQTLSKKTRTNITVDGYNVYQQSLRYATFYQKGVKCACCGRVGSYFTLDPDRNGDNSGTRHHFNLYSEDGVLMTKDHIRPRKLGGKDHIDNLQTMCVECNREKGSNYEITIPSIVGVNVNNPEHKVKYLNIEDAVSAICNIKCIYSKGGKPSTMGRKIIHTTLEFMKILNTDTPYCGYVWSEQKVMWEGKSYDEKFHN